MASYTWVSERYIAWPLEEVSTRTCHQEARDRDHHRPHQTRVIHLSNAPCSRKWCRHCRLCYPLDIPRQRRSRRDCACPPLQETLRVSYAQKGRPAASWSACNMVLGEPDAKTKVRVLVQRISTARGKGRRATEPCLFFVFPVSHTRSPRWSTNTDLSSLFDAAAT
jgi:hypothetical protein